MAWILLAGALVWALSEILELVKGGFTPLNSTASALAFVLIALGVWALWRQPGQNRIGQSGIATLSIGMVLFAVVAVQVVMSGAVNDAEISDTPIFLAAGGLVSIGALQPVSNLVLAAVLAWLGWRMQRA